jgi:hypothetical protein
MSEEDNLDLEKRAAAILQHEQGLKDELLSEAMKIAESTELNAPELVSTDQENGLSIAEIKGVVERQSEDVRTLIQKATLPQKIKLALLGNATCRSLLVKDSNKMIQQLVLKNPKLQPTEVEEFAKNPNLPEMVLRNIAEDSQWMRSYSLKQSIVFNPKTPQALSLKWIKFLNTSDLRRIAKSKNVPNILTVAARKKLADMEG